MSSSVIVGAGGGTGHGMPPRLCLKQTYTYLRLAIVSVLLALGAAVGIQTHYQGWHPLASVSAYYYTPARAVFVSALVAFAVCLIALRGTRTVDDVTLNLAGMFALLVGIVPTSRGEDYRAAVRACRDVAQAASTRPLDCPTVRSLEKSARADMTNSVLTFLAVTALALVVVLVMHLGDVRADPRSTFVAGYSLLAGLWLVVAVTFGMARDWFSDNAHFLSAVGLFGCVLVIAVANAFRRRADEEPSRPDGADGEGVATGTVAAADPGGIGHARLPSPRDRYALVAFGLLAVAAVGGTLWRTGVVTLFWLEIAVAAMFVVLWVVQTIEDPITRDNQDTSVG